MNILVTGTAGFIGCEVALRLLARGDTVIGIDNFNERARGSQPMQIIIIMNFAFPMRWHCESYSRNSNRSALSI